MLRLYRSVIRFFTECLEALTDEPAEQQLRIRSKR